MVDGMQSCHGRAHCTPMTLYSVLRNYPRTQMKCTNPKRLRRRRSACDFRRSSARCSRSSRIFGHDFARARGLASGNREAQVMRHARGSGYKMILIHASKPKHASHDCQGRPQVPAKCSWCVNASPCTKNTLQSHRSNTLLV